MVGSLHPFLDGSTVRCSRRSMPSNPHSCAGHSDSTVGAPSGAMLFCTVRNSTSSSLPFDRLRTGRTSSGQGPSDFALRVFLHRYAAHFWGRSKAFTRLQRASHFLLRGQEKVTKEKATPMRWSPGILPCDCAAGLRGFADSTSMCWQRTGRDPSRPPYGPFPRPVATAYGTLVARILRARAKSNVKSVGRSRSGCESSGAGGKGPEE